MTAVEARSKSWSAGLAAVLGLLAVCFCVAALMQPPQLRDFSIYFAFVAALLLLGGAAVWRASSARLAPLEPVVLRRVSLTQWFMTALVWANPAALMGYACVALVMVGHWPSYGQPDPKSLDLPVLHVLVFLSHYVSAIGLLAWLVCFPFASRALGPRGVRAHTVAFVLGVAAIYLVFFKDLGGVGEWFFD